MKITIDDIYPKLGLETHIGVLHFDVGVYQSGPALVAAMEDGAEVRMQELMGEAASTDPIISAVRAVFHTLGKDPSRYRPSSEALTRRILSGKGLHHVNNVVDCGNLISLMTGIPVGCYDSAWIQGDITLRVGMPGETYDGIRKGSVNLELLPILADKAGAFGCPFSDSSRTAISDNTKNLTFVLYGLNIDVAHVEAAAEMADTLISRFCAPQE